MVMDIGYDSAKTSTQISIFHYIRRRAVMHSPRRPYRFLGVLYPSIIVSKV